MLAKQAKDGNYGQEGPGIMRTEAAVLRRVMFCSSYAGGDDSISSGGDKNMNTS